MESEILKNDSKFWENLQYLWLSTIGRLNNGSEFTTFATAPAGTISVGLRARALRGD